MDSQQAQTGANEPKVLTHRLNRRLILTTLAVALALAAGVHLLHGVQVDRNAEQLLGHARQAREKGKIDEAVRFYTEFLNYRPRDVDAAAELGVLLEQEFSSPGSLRQVYMTFEKILRLEPQRSDIRRRVANVYVQLGRFHDALAHLAALEKNKDEQTQAAEDAELAALTGQCHLGLGHYAQAAEAYAAAIARAPEVVEHYSVLCHLLVHRSSEIPAATISSLTGSGEAASATAEQAADVLMDSLVQRGRPAFRAYLARAAYRKSRGQLEPARQDVNRALELAPDETDAIYIAAELSLQQAQNALELARTEQVEAFLKSAAEYARRGLGRNPPEPRFDLILARIELARRDTAAAISALEQGLERFPAAYEGAAPTDLKLLAEAERQLAFTLADLLIRSEADEAPDGTPPEQADRSSRVEELIRRMLNRGMSPELIEFLRAQQYLAQQDWVEAAGRLYAVQRKLEGHGELARRVYLDLNTCYERMGNPDAQLSVLQSAVNHEPLWVAARLELARTLTVLNRYDEAIERYRPLLGSPGVPAQVVRLLTLKKMSVAQSRRDWSRIERVFAEAEEAGADPTRLAVLRAETRLHQKQYEEAARILDEAQQRAPDEVAVRIAQILLAVHREDVGRAERLATAREILNQAESDFAGDLQLHLARIQVALLQPTDAAIDELAALEQEASKLDDDDRRELLTRLARAHESIGAEDRAEAAWRRLTREFPNEMDHWFALGIRAAQEGRPVQEVLSEIRRIEGPDGPNGNYLEAALLIEQVGGGGRDLAANLSRARRLLRTAAAHRPSWAAIPRAQGRLEELAGSRTEALSFYERAMDLGDRSPEIVVRRLYLLSEMGRDEEAVELALAIGFERPEFLVGDVGRIARTLFVQQRDLEQAYRFAEGLAGTSDDFWDLLWFAELRYQRGERGQEIDEAFREAVKLAPEEPDSWLALVRHLFRTGRVLEARATLNRAHEHLPEHLLAATLARGHEMVRDAKNAEKYYIRAVESAPENIAHLKAIADFYHRNGQTAKAEEYLNRIVDSGTGAADPDVAWARRNQALLLAARGGYDRSLQAIDLLERNGESAPADMVSDLRVKALLLARRPIRRDRLEAIRVFESIRERGHELAPSEVLQLAELYEAVRDWPRAKREYERLVASERRTASHVARYVQALLRNGEVAEAGPWMEILLDVAPELYLTAKTRARYLHATGKGDQGAALLKAWLREHRPRPLPDWFVELVRSDDLAQAVEARIADPAAQQDEGIRTALAEAQQLLQQHEHEQALARIREHHFAWELEQAHHTTAIHEAAVVCEEIARFEAAEELFRDYVARSNRSDAVFSLARFLSRRGRIGDALDVCERARGRCDPELLASAAVSVIGRSSIIGGGEATPEQIRKVESWVESALADNPGSTTCIVALADLRLMQQRLVEAEALYRRLLPENDRHVIALNNLAWLLAFQGRNADEALQRVNRAIEIAGPRPDLLDTRAIIYLNKNQPDRAIDDLQAALEDTSFAIGYVHLAQAYVQARQIEQAASMLAKSREEGLDPARLHPLERRRYDKLIEDLQRHTVASSTT